MIKKQYFLFFIPIFIAAYFNVGFFHPDEHYQLLEFANYKMGNISAADLPWEFETQMRPSLQPMLVVWLWKVYVSVFNFNPFVLALILRLITAILSVSAFVVVYRVFSNQKNSAFIYFLCSGMLWFIPSVAVRYSSETWAAIFLAFAFALIYKYINYKNKFFALFLGGFLLACSFWFRFQIGFMIAGFFICLWVYKKITFQQTLIVFLGSGFGVYLFYMLDCYFYQTNVFTPYQYFYQNIVLDKASNFGEENFIYYPKETFKYLFPLFSIPIAYFILKYFFQNIKHPIIWASVVFLIAHFGVAHKEFRFLFPLYIFLPLVIAHSSAEILHYYEKYPKILKIGLLINLVFLCIAVLKPTDINVFNQQQLSENYKYPKSVFVQPNINDTLRSAFYTDFYNVLTTKPSNNIRYKAILSNELKPAEQTTDMFLLNKPMYKYLYWARNLNEIDRIVYIENE